MTVIECGIASELLLALLPAGDSRVGRDDDSVDGAICNRGTLAVMTPAVD